MSEAILTDDANPYSTPDASLDSGQSELYQPKIFSFSGRIGRLRYLAYGLGVNFLLMLAMIPLFGASAFMGGDPTSSMIGMVGIGVFYLFTFVITIMFAKRRFNDLNRSGWWSVLVFVPLLNLFAVIYLVFFPGTNGDNNFGLEPVSNSIGVLILGWMFPALMILGIVAAVAIPQLVGMVPQ